jgi:hypothetical protein
MTTRSDIDDIVFGISSLLLEGKENLKHFEGLSGVSKHDPSQLIKGFDVEKEHSKTVAGDSKTIAKIVLDHLTEDPEYYTKLIKAGL